MTNTPLPSPNLPSIDALKQQAKRLRAGLDEDGDFITHSESLELVAKQHGYRDWNTLHAAIGNRPPIKRFQLGSRVKGRYLGQPFKGEIIAIRSMPPDRLRVVLKFDEPVDVVTFDSFSAYRSRVSVTINAEGLTAEKTSDGAPQLVMEAL
ncbi:glyoxalase superfamily protein [Hyphococcus sp.]|uniref:glyoxalase superfamily protein n=1 Tax=Hyphococcus sp. TaxID=2038636 RepID=UPI0035C6E9CC